MRSVREASRQDDCTTTVHEKNVCAVGVLFTGGRFMHLVVLYGYQGAVSDAEQHALTEQLFDAALGELGVVARGQPFLIVGDFNVELTKIPCVSKGISAGFSVDLDAAWAVAGGMQLPVTCKRTWQSTGGHRRDFMVGCSLLVGWSLTGGLRLIFLLGPILTVSFELARLLSLFNVLLCGPLLGYLLFMREGVPSWWRSRGFGRSLMIVCSSWQGLMRSCWMSLCGWVMSLVLAWAAEAALAGRLCCGERPCCGVWHCSASGGQARWA